MSDVNFGKWVALALCACAVGLVGLRLSAPAGPAADPGGAMSRTEARLASIIEPYLGAGDFRLVVNPVSSGDVILMVGAETIAARDPTTLETQLVPLIAAATGRAEETVRLSIRTAPFHQSARTEDVRALAEWGLLGLMTLGAFGLALAQGRNRQSRPLPDTMATAPSARSEPSASASETAVQIHKWLSEAKTG